MRRLFAVMIIAALMAGCNQNAASDKPAAAATASADSIRYPYKPLYSSSFKIGEPAYAKTVLDIWKSYEENRLQDTKESWADSITMEFADGFKLHTSRDSLIAGGVADRAQYSSVVDSVYAWMPLHSIDKDEDWVGVWAMEYTTTTKGKKDTVDIHEIWQVKKGKVTYMAQYKGKRKM
jgi:hypothetical protein